MSRPRRALVAVLCGVALVAGLVVGAISAQQEAPSATQARARAPLFDEAFVQQVYKDAVEALEQGAGVKLQEPVPALLLTVDEARARRKAFTQGMSEDAGMTAAADLLADFVFSDSMLGRYLPDEKALYIIEEVLEDTAHGDRDRARELLFGVMAHELTHAHDDQVYHAMPQIGPLVKELIADGNKILDVQAQMSLLEGHATYAAELACRQAGEPTLPAFSLEEAREAKVMDARGDGAAEQVGAGVVNVVARAKLVQYAWGREFCKRAHSFGGEKFMGQVFASLPLKLSELQDFEVFRQRWAADMEKKMEAEEAEPTEAAPAPAPTPSESPSP